MLHHYYVLNEGLQNGFPAEMINDKRFELDMVLYKIVDDDVKLQKEFNHARQHRPKFFAVNDVFSDNATADKLKNFLDNFIPNHLLLKNKFKPLQKKYLLWIMFLNLHHCKKKKIII